MLFFATSLTGELYKISWSNQSLSWDEMIFSTVSSKSVNLVYSAGQTDFIPSGFYYSKDNSVFHITLQKKHNYLLSLPSKIYSLAVMENTLMPGIYAGCENGYIYRIYFSSSPDAWNFYPAGNGSKPISAIAVGKGRNTLDDYTYASSYDGWIYENGKRVVNLSQQLKLIKIDIGKTDDIYRLYAVDIFNNIYQITYISGTDIWDIIE